MDDFFDEIKTFIEFEDEDNLMQDLMTRDNLIDEGEEDEYMMSYDENMPYSPPMNTYDANFFQFFKGYFGKELVEEMFVDLLLPYYVVIDKKTN